MAADSDLTPLPALSIVAAPKRFVGHTGIIQRNALESWRRLPIAGEVILVGAEQDVRQAAESAGVLHCPPASVDAYGVPTVDGILRAAAAHATSHWVCYVNGDIILLPAFATAVRKSIAALGRCLVVSRRWNLDVRSPLRFDVGWDTRLEADVAGRGMLFSRYGIDVFVFPKDLYPAVPPFSVGRPCWDNWMIGAARRTGHPVVDVTADYSVIHQNHPYDALTSPATIRRSQQALRNFWLAGDSFANLGHAGDATHELRDGKIVPRDLPMVSVVIPHAGSSRQLAASLAALAEQSYPRTYVNVIVVDNAEGASSAAAALEWPFLTVTRERKRGPAAARNKGAAIATGDLIAFLDSDCVPAGTWIEAAVATARAHEMRAIVACNIRPKLPTTRTRAVERYDAHMYHDQKGYVKYSQACITGGMMVPRSLWMQIGPFDEDFPEAACEDWEWSTRASASGVPIVYARDAVVVHPVYHTWEQLRHKAKRLARGELILARKRGWNKALSIAIQHDHHVKRLRAQLKRILVASEIPRHAKPGVACAACAVFAWSLTETRRQLASTTSLVWSWGKRPRPPAFGYTRRRPA
jgi:GT2 family glycosyltransferase